MKKKDLYIGGLLSLNILIVILAIFANVGGTNTIIRSNSTSSPKVLPSISDSLYLNYGYNSYSWTSK